MFIKHHPHNKPRARRPTCPVAQEAEVWDVLLVLLVELAHCLSGRVSAGLICALYFRVFPPVRGDLCVRGQVLRTGPSLEVDGRRILRLLGQNWSQAVGASTAPLKIMATGADGRHYSPRGVQT